MTATISKKSLYADPETKPVALTPSLDAIPADLAAVTRWVLWRIIWAGERWTKVPYRPNNNKAKSNDPATWVDFASATAAFGSGRFDGVGFMLGDGYTGIDLDDCRNAENGVITRWATEIIADLASYAEVSPSGTGVKVFVRGTWKGARNRWKCGTGEVEVYSVGRFFTVTGRGVGSTTEVAEAQQALDRLAAACPPPASASASPARASVPSHTAPPGVGDDDLMALISKSKGAEKFNRLWNGDASEYDGDESRADLALCGILGFWIGPDERRIDAWFRRSGLARPKWDARHAADGRTYGQLTIEKSLAGRTEFHDPSRSPSTTPRRATVTTDSPAATSTSPRPASIPEYVGFPMAALPERVQGFVRAVAASTNTDPAFTALPLLSLLGAIIGTTRAVMPKRGWKVFPGIWACTVGRSASGKSPPLAAVNEAVQPLVDDLDDENADAIEDHHEAKARHLNDKSKKGHPPPAEPPAKRFRVGDTTVEALAVILHANPRGVWLMSDELHGWFGSFTRYGGGKGNTDRPKWLTLFDAGSLEVDRKTGEPRHVSVRNTLVGIAGGIQPGILRSAMTEENVGSGLFARILLAYPPDRLTQWSEAEVPEEMTADLTALLRSLRMYGFAEIDGRRAPGLNTLHPDAKKLFVEFFNANRRQAFTGDDAEAAAAVKLESYALRFAHLRHLCRHAGGDDSAPVSADDMAAGITLAEWFLNELHRVRALLGEPERMQGQRRLADWVRRQGGAVSGRDLRRSYEKRYPTTAAAETALEQLAADGFGEWRDEVAANNKTVRRFHLHPQPDARRCPTLTTDADDTGPDVEPDADPTPPVDSLKKQGERTSTSGNVGRRVGSATATGDHPLDGAASGSTSGDPFPFGHNVAGRLFDNPTTKLPD